jgi:rhodanese-related sulfurtransferase
MLSKLPVPPRSRGSRRVVPCVVLSTTLLGVPGCDAQDAVATPSPEPRGSAFEFLTADQLQALIRRGAVLTIVDARMRRDYLAGHIPSAVSLPYVQLSYGYRLLDGATALVLYCDTERNSVPAAQQLARLGFSNLYVLAGGFAGWRYAVESGYRPQVP